MRAQKGITLVALIITIIVLLILAVVTIASITNGGVKDNAEAAVNLHQNKVAVENTILDGYTTTINTAIQAAQ